jgi:hypothetical protein
MSTLEIESHRYVRAFAWSPHWEMPIPHSLPRVECPFFSTTAKESQRTIVLCIARKYTPWQSVWHFECSVSVRTLCVRRSFFIQLDSVSVHLSQIAFIQECITLVLKLHKGVIIDQHRRVRKCCVPSGSGTTVLLMKSGGVKDPPATAVWQRFGRRVDLDGRSREGSTRSHHGNFVRQSQRRSVCTLLGRTDLWHDGGTLGLVEHDERWFGVGRRL